MKKLTIVTVITACLILCAAVWPQGRPAEEVAVASPSAAVTTTQPEALATLEIKEPIAPEEEKIEIPPSEIAHDITSEPEPLPDPMPEIPETQVIAEPEPAPEDTPTTPESLPTPEPELTPASAPSQADTDPQPGDMIYVPGLGWLECQGPGEVIYDTEIHENGNKIGSMG